MFCLTTKHASCRGDTPLTPPLAIGEKGTKMKKEKRVTIRFTEDEYKQLKAKADELDISLSTYIRKKALGNKERISSKCNKELLYEINRIGNNLNQIAKHCNINKLVDKLVLKSLVEIEKKLNEVIKW